MMMQFELGKVTVTARAKEALKRNGQKPGEFVSRHASGDWGDVPRWIAKANASAVEKNKRIMSSYSADDGQVLWVVTEPDQLSTRVLLPWESALTAGAVSRWRAGWASFWHHSSPCWRRDPSLS